MEDVRIKLDTYKEQKLLEIIRWAFKPRGWTLMSTSPYFCNISRPFSSDYPLGAREVVYCGFLEVLINIVAPTLGMRTITLDLENKYSIIDIIFERYEGYLNSEVGEETIKI